MSGRNPARERRFLPRPGARVTRTVGLILLLLALPISADDRERSPEAGIAITPDFARSLYDRIAPLRESDGCILRRFDTAHTRIAITLQAPAGREHSLTLEVARQSGFAGCASPKWAVAPSPDLAGECSATFVAIKHILAQMPLPQRRGTRLFPPDNYTLLAAQFFLLLVGTAHILCREVMTRRPPVCAATALLSVWIVGLALRLELSPRTFLHEYYHIAETIDGYLSSEMAPAYGRTGPALYRLLGTVLERPDDVSVIFVTNAVLASLAIPAVALLDLALVGSWSRAICAAVLLCILPQHLRFSAAEDFFVLAVTFGFWALASFALYLRTHRLEDALCAALALSLGVQTRPEMAFFPLVMLALAWAAPPSSWRVLVTWRTMVALALSSLLLAPRFLELRAVAGNAPPRLPLLPELGPYLDALVLFEADNTPVVYVLLLAVGALWAARDSPRVLTWVIVVFVGYSLILLSSLRFPSRLVSTPELVGNPIYNLRSQLLPTSFTVLVAAGVAPAWMALWRNRRRAGCIAGAGVLAALSVVTVITWMGFVTELYDQQREWSFLERTVPRLPQRATLLSAVEVGDFRLNAFPRHLLTRDAKRYELVDVRNAAAGEVPWPEPGDDLLFYQGMFCHFAGSPDEPVTAPLGAACQAVHERYVAEPLIITELDAQGYSQMPLRAAPFRIGFFRLRAAR